METNLKKIQSGSYNPHELARITEILRHACKPEYILLFGALASATPHSDVVAYDLLVVTREEPYYDWAEAKRYLKLKFPTKHREIAYINLYVYSRAFIERHPSPVFYFAKSEGIPLYVQEQAQVPKSKAFNFNALNKEVSSYFDTFFNLGERFLDEANNCLITDDIRQGSFLMAQAALLFYRTLFFVYHGFESNSEDIELLHDRFRTVSADLMLLFDSDQHRAIGTIPRMKKMLIDARYNLTFTATSKQLEADYDRIEKLKNGVEKLCRHRFDLYRERIDN